MYYANKEGYILVRDDGAHVPHGEVRVSEHAAKMALANYMKRSVGDLLLNKGYHEDIAGAIEFVWEQTGFGINLDDANDDWVRYGVCSKRYKVTMQDLQMVNESMRKERKRWKIVCVPIA